MKYFGLLYKVKNLINGKIYIEQTIDLITLHRNDYIRPVTNSIYGKHHSGSAKHIDSSVYIDIGGIE